jgi:two-component system sensor histidine kinase VanS
MSARARLTFSYAAFLLIAGGLILAVVWLFLLRYVPDGPIDTTSGFVPNRSDLTRAFVPAATTALAFLLVLGVGGGWLLAGRMLEPLARIHAATRLAAEGSLSHRIDMRGRADEFGELADAFDVMLATLERHVGEQRRFAANASHELRTPLAITQTLLDVARNDPDRDVDVLIDRLQHVNTRAVQLTDALLLLSLADVDAVGTDSVDLSLVAEAAAEDLLPLAEQRGVALEVSGDPVDVLGSTALLHQMAVNLLHNAIVHNVEGGGFVRVSTAMQYSHAVLRIENSGASLDGADLATLLEPFQRGGGRVRTRDHAATGLGLAIVRHIVDAHRGRLRMEARVGGGAVLEVRLPVGVVGGVDRFPHADGR